MRFRIRMASVKTTKPCNAAYQENNTWYVDIGTLEELMRLIDEVGSDLIIDADSIIIYDDYVE